MASEVWYVPVTLTWDAGLKAHIVQAAVPDDVYAIKNAWDQEEIEFGCWKLTFRPEVTLTADQKTRMAQMGCVPITSGKPTKPTEVKRRDVLVKNKPIIEEP